MAAKNSRKFELRLGKTGLIVFIFGLALLVFFSFILGVTVGKHIEAYPEMLARGIPAMVKEKLGLSAVHEETAVNAAGEDGKAAEETTEDFGLTFYDTLGGKKGAADAVIAGREEKKERTAREITQPVPQEASAKKADIKPADEVAAAAKSTVAASLPAEKGTDKKTLSGVSGDASGADRKKEAGKYLVHVVSFQDRTKADDILKKLTAMGYKAQVVAVDLPGKGKWFRVVMTGYANREEAKQASDKVAKSISGVHCVVVPE
ncbi:MAG: SPOR domain-containing protein [Deltaproteobacteria bacterium]|nr:SPOR domain-containing protein [Deltaproteobacteria bacterium]